MSTLILPPGYKRSDAEHLVPANPAVVEAMRRRGQLLEPIGMNKHGKPIQPIVGAADGLFYWDTREPFIGADVASVTLLNTDLALYPASNFPVLGGQYFARIGKKLRIRLFGRITTVLTPGNGTFDIYYGTGGAANGVLLGSSGTVALTASQTSLSWMCEIFVHCRSIGSAGTLFLTGIAHFNVSVIASTLQPLMIPASLPAVSGACDLTAALIISVQFKRSGSTAETMQVHDMEVTAVN